MDIEGIFLAEITPQLANRLNERKPLNIANGAADLNDCNISLPLKAQDRLLDFVGYMRNHLDCTAKVITPALLGNYTVIDTPGGVVMTLAQLCVGVSLVVAQIEIGLSAIVSNKHLAVLKRVHGAWIHVDVGIQFLHGYSKPPCLKQGAKRGCRKPLAQRGKHASRHKDIFSSHAGPLPDQS